VALVVPLIAREEAAMRAAYGDGYERYRQATARLVPFLY
jgi:protein-S-isoprenylcysteine O-methyltransferase Ste14